MKSVHESETYLIPIGIGRNLIIEQRVEFAYRNI